MHKLLPMFWIFCSDVIAEPRTSLPFLGTFYQDNGSIYNSIIFYNSFTIRLRPLSLRTKYLRMAVTLKFFDIKNIITIIICHPQLEFAMLVPV